PEQGQYVEAWKALIALQERGLVRTIGVSNYPEAQLEEIIEATGAAPAIHQIELHPYFQQRELRAVHERHGILTEAWGPLGQGKSDLLENPAVTSAAEAHGASPAQVVLAWHLAHGIVTIPKSVTPSRIVENLASVDVTLTADEVAAIDALDRPDGRGGAAPATRTAWGPAAAGPDGARARAGPGSVVDRERPRRPLDDLHRGVEDPGEDRAVHDLVDRAGLDHAAVLHGDDVVGVVGREVDVVQDHHDGA